MRKELLCAWAGDANRFSVSGTASWLRGKLGWYSISASSRKQSTIALSSGEAELVAALSGVCEGMSLRQQWNWLLKFGCNVEETDEATRQILCCDSSAAQGTIKRKGSTRKTRHIELKAFFLQQWSARPKVRLVQVGTSDMLAECLRKIQPTPHSVHLSRLGLDIKIHSLTDLNLVEKIERRWSVEIPLFFFDNFVVVLKKNSPRSLTFYNELRWILSTQFCAQICWHGVT